MTKVTAADLNPFDPASLRLDQSFVETGGAKKLLTTVPVRKPGKQDFNRVHHDPDFRLSPAAVIELKDERETYLVMPSMAAELSHEMSLVTLYTAINRQGVVFLWPVKLPSADGRQQEWHLSAAEAAERAMNNWIRITANMSLGAYEIFEANAVIPDPIWPDVTLPKLLEVAFRHRLVKDEDHPVLKRLSGAI